MGPGGPMMGPNGQLGPGRPGGPPCDMNMGPMGPSGPMRPMNSDIGDGSPGSMNVNSSKDSGAPHPSSSSMSSCSLDGGNMTTSMTNTTSSIQEPGFNDPSTPDPTRGDGSQSPSESNLRGKYSRFF